MTGQMERNRLGIIVAGGPAPGINSVIHSATIEAVNNGYEVVGIFDGFKHLMKGQLVCRSLTINDVSRIHLDGGSILRTSRANPTTAPELLEKCGRALVEGNIGYLLAIGGDDTAYSAYRVARYTEEHMNVDIHVAH
ncbi:MAG: 6-phosphofructokinase, partial [Anaerolineae bacterium]